MNKYWSCDVLKSCPQSHKNQGLFRTYYLLLTLPVTKLSMRLWFWDGHKACWLTYNELSHCHSFWMKVIMGIGIWSVFIHKIDTIALIITGPSSFHTHQTIICQCIRFDGGIFSVALCLYTNVLDRFSKNLQLYMFESNILKSGTFST